MWGCPLDHPQLQLSSSKGEACTASASSKSSPPKQGGVAAQLERFSGSGGTVESWEANHTLSVLPGSQLQCWGEDPGTGWEMLSKQAQMPFLLTLPLTSLSSLWKDRCGLRKAFPTPAVRKGTSCCVIWVYSCFLGSTWEAGTRTIWNPWALPGRRKCSDRAHRCCFSCANDWGFAQVQKTLL